MRYIVVTDLDGTLLDHQTYEFTPALNAIEALKKHEIPIILNSSKTQAEILEIRSQLHNQEPFVCENGGVLCGINQQVQYLGVPRHKFLTHLPPLKQKLNLNYESFAEASIDDVVRWTGLSRSDAQKAMEREATEPLLWHDSERAIAKFRQELQCLNLQCVKGGRFYHVMGTFDKASCFAQLKEYYSQGWQDQIEIIALGDSQNDLPMLEQAVISIVIPSKHGTHSKPNRNDVFFASQPGPRGWQQGIDYVLKTIF